MTSAGGRALQSPVADQTVMNSPGCRSPQAGSTLPSVASPAGFATPRHEQGRAHLFRFLIAGGSGPPLRCFPGRICRPTLRAGPRPSSPVPHRQRFGSGLCAPAIGSALPPHGSSLAGIRHRRTGSSNHCSHLARIDRPSDLPPPSLAQDTCVLWRMKEDEMGEDPLCAPKSST